MNKNNLKYILLFLTSLFLFYIQKKYINNNMIYYQTIANEKKKSFYFFKRYLVINKKKKSFLYRSVILKKYTKKTRNEIYYELYLRKNFTKKIQVFNDKIYNLNKIFIFYNENNSIDLGLNYFSAINKQLHIISYKEREILFLFANINIFI